jgi:membrane protease YdiL (CAAX protease family)
MIGWEMVRTWGFARLLVVVVVWAASFRLLSLYGVDLMPRAFARQLTLEMYLALVQVLTLAIGLVAALLLVQAPREQLALATSKPSAVVVGALLTPAIFVVATGAAFQIARPTLLEELARGGVALVQKSTGEFGRELTQAPLALSLLWGAVVSPIAEELFFRGALFTLVLSVTEPRPKNEAPDALSPELLQDGAAARAFGASVEWLRRGGAATIVVALVFGFLHRDMPGGLGIVRFVSALGLGLACGLARQLTGSVVPPITIHMGFNALSLCTARRLVVSETFPMKSGVPTLVAAVGAALFWAIALRYLLSRRAAGA